MTSGSAMAEGGASAPTTAPLLVIDGLSKSFGQNQALRSASLQVMGGEVHGLMGHNGSGKSTLVKILSGYHEPTAGTITLQGQVLGGAGRGRLPAGCGLVVLQQDLGLVDTLTVLENITIRSASIDRFRRVQSRHDAREVAGLLEQLGSPVPVEAPVSTLSATERVFVAVARLLHEVEVLAMRACLVVLDEPTSALSVAEAHQIGDAIGGLTARGFGVLYVTHRLDEALQVCDQISVLRDGALVGTVVSSDVDEARLAELMFGVHDSGHASGEGATGMAMMEDGVPAATGVVHNSVLRVRRLALAGGATLDLEISPGEVVGVTGAAASDHVDIVHRVYGLITANLDEVAVCGQPLRRRSPYDMRRAGMGFVSGDRARSGGVTVASVAENLATVFEQDEVGPLHRLRLRQERKRSADVMAHLGIAPLHVGDPFNTLSGGNQQKILVGRWLFSGIKVLLLDEPTVGVDMQSVHRIIALIRDFASEGRGALVSSTEYGDLPQLCDRLLVFSPDGDRRWLEGSEITREAVITLAYGTRTTELAR